MLDFSGFGPSNSKPDEIGVPKEKKVKIDLMEMWSEAIRQARSNGDQAEVARLQKLVADSMKPRESMPRPRPKRVIGVGEVISGPSVREVKDPDNERVEIPFAEIKAMAETKRRLETGVDEILARQKAKFMDLDDLEKRILVGLGIQKKNPARCDLEIEREVFLIRGKEGKREVTMRFSLEDDKTVLIDLS